MEDVFSGSCDQREGELCVSAEFVPNLEEEDMRWNSERQGYEHKNLRILKEISVRKRIIERGTNQCSKIKSVNVKWKYHGLMAIHLLH